MTSAICFRDVDLVYPNGFYGLKQLSLDVAPGEFVAVIGRSGSGKSTLLRAINRTIAVKKGRAEVLGQDVSAISRTELRHLRGRIGFIFQQFNLVKNLSALDNVLHGRLSHVSLLRSLLGLYSSDDLALANEALATVGLEGKQEARIDELSGGQQQRVAIARAVVQKPEIILADEPMSSLDPKLAEVVLDLLQKFNREQGTTILVNMHVLEQVRRYAPRVIGLREGHIVFDGPASKLDDQHLRAVYEGASS